MTPELHFIGHIQTPYKDLSDCPRQPRPQDGFAKIIVDEAYASAITGLNPGSIIQVLYWFDKADRSVVKTVPPWASDDQERGVFSIRSPHRPNPIALSRVEVMAIDDNIITVSAMDCLDGTNLLDIKPYIDHLQKLPSS